MKLSAKERIMLQQILPAAGPLTSSDVMLFRLDLCFTLEEINEHNIRKSGDRILWDGAEFYKEIPIKGSIMNIIMGAFSRMDIIPLFVRFLNETKPVKKG